MEHSGSTIDRTDDTGEDMQQDQPAKYDAPELREALARELGGDPEDYRPS